MTAETTAHATNFAAEFPATEAAWRHAAEAALKGRALEDVLRGRLIDGTTFDAILPRAPVRPIAGRAAGARWTAMTRIDIADPEVANAQALEDLNNGASGLSLALAHRSGGGGLVADTLDRLDLALKDVLLDLAPIHVEVPHFDGRTTAALFASLVERRGHRAGDVRILFGLDLMRDLTQTGTMSLPWEAMGPRAASTVEALLARGFKAPILMMDQRTPHDAGASEAQELGGALASAVEHIRVMGENGLEAEQVADTISFAFSCDADQFASIAKLRAARLVWAALRRELGLPDRPIHIHAQTSRRMLAKKDPQTNIVRSAIAAFAAGVAGADSIVVLPHTLALGGADGDARRIARNTQAIVLEEANAFRVADPAAGAGAIEALTETLAERGWDAFREIERRGGMFAAMTSGYWQECIKETRMVRAEAVARRKIAIVGVSEFPKAGEPTIEFPEEPGPSSTARGDREMPFPGDDVATFEAIVAAYLGGASAADINAGWKARPTVSATPLELRRTAEPFERLRLANEALEPGPRVFLALLGPIARHAGRAGFIRNLLDAGGVSAIDGPVSVETKEVVGAFAASGAAIAILCGADDDYAESGPEMIRALGEEGATVWLAGRPKNGREELEAAGLSRFVAAGDDAIAILTEASAAALADAEQGAPA